MYSETNIGMQNSNIIGFIPSANLDVAASFYTGLLGLEMVNRDEYALEYVINQTKLRIAKVGQVSKANYTILGWEVNDIHSLVKELNSKGVEFIFYEGMPQDDIGICTFPGGSKVAWFKDPDENILSLTQI